MMWPAGATFGDSQAPVLVPYTNFHPTNAPPRRALCWGYDWQRRLPSAVPCDGALARRCPAACRCDGGVAVSGRPRPPPTRRRRPGPSRNDGRRQPTGGRQEHRPAAPQHSDNSAAPPPCTIHTLRRPTARTWTPWRGLAHAATAIAARRSTLKPSPTRRALSAALARTTRWRCGRRRGRPAAAPSRGVPSW